MEYQVIDIIVGGIVIIPNTDRNNYSSIRTLTLPKNVKAGDVREYEFKGTTIQSSEKPLNYSEWGVSFHVSDNGVPSVYSIGPGDIVTVADVTIVDNIRTVNVILLYTYGLQDIGKPTIPLIECVEGTPELISRSAIFSLDHNEILHLLFTMDTNSTSDIFRLPVDQNDGFNNEDKASSEHTIFSHNYDKLVASKFVYKDIIQRVHKPSSNMRLKFMPTHYIQYIDSKVFITNSPTYVDNHPNNIEVFFVKPLSLPPGGPEVRIFVSGNYDEPINTYYVISAANKHVVYQLIGNCRTGRIIKYALKCYVYNFREFDMKDNPLSISQHDKLYRKAGTTNKLSVFLPAHSYELMKKGGFIKNYDTRILFDEALSFAYEYDTNIKYSNNISSIKKGTYKTQSDVLSTLDSIMGIVSYTGLPNIVDKARQRLGIGLGNIGKTLEKAIKPTKLENPKPVPWKQNW